MALPLHRLPVPALPGVPPALTAVLRRALASDPRERTPDAATLRDELAAVPLAASPAHAPSARAQRLTATPGRSDPPPAARRRTTKRSSRPHAPEGA